MALQAFAKSDDLLLLAPDIDQATADMVLSIVSGAIRDAIRWDVDYKVGRVTTQKVRPGSVKHSITLPALNVTVITTVKVDGTTIASTEYDATEAGVVYLKSPAYKSVEVTYTAGYARTPVDNAPPVFRLAALEYATRLAGNPSGARSYAMGGTSETFADAALSMATDDERLDPYRVDQ